MEFVMDSKIREVFSFPAYYEARTKSISYAFEILACYERWITHPLEVVCWKGTYFIVKKDSDV
jgi:hypothetical protein